MSNRAVTRIRPSVLARRRPVVDGQRAARPGIGGAPQVSLLPDEVRHAGANAQHRRVLVALVVLSAGVAVAAVVAAGGVEADAQARLARASAETQALTAQIAKFSDVRALQQQIALGEAAVKVGSSTIIDWDQQIRDIEAEMPAGYVVSAISAAGATPTELYPQGTTALEPRRAATVLLTVSAPSVGDEYSTWLRRIRSIPAYADATATYTSGGSGTYTVNLTVHLSPKAIVATQDGDSR